MLLGCHNSLVFFNLQQSLNLFFCVCVFHDLGIFEGHWLVILYNVLQIRLV